MSEKVQTLMEGTKDLSNNIANTGSQLFGNATDIASTTISTSVSKISDSVDIVKETSSKYLNNIKSVSFAIIILIIVSVLVGYGLYVIITDKITYQQRITVSGTEVPILCNEISEFKILENIDNKNGNRRSFTFWIYINDINKYAGEQYRHIAHIGESAKSVKTASPYIILDKISNKIHFRFSTISDNVDDDLLNNFDNIDDFTNYSGTGGVKKCGFTIEYVPIQRWVHIAISINDINNGSIYIYVDGELIEIKEKKLNYDINVAELKLYNKGDLFTGGDINDTTNGIIGFSGLLSKFTIFNQDLNQNDVYKEYNNGPFSGILTQMGLSAYGIRNPVYKLNNANN